MHVHSNLCELTQFARQRMKTLGHIIIVIHNPVRRTAIPSLHIGCYGSTWCYPQDGADAGANSRISIAPWTSELKNHCSAITSLAHIHFNNVHIMLNFKFYHWIHACQMHTGSPICTKYLLRSDMHGTCQTQMADELCKLRKKTSI